MVGASVRVLYDNGCFSGGENRSRSNTKKTHGRVFGGPQRQLVTRVLRPGPRCQKTTDPELPAVDHRALPGQASGKIGG